MPCGIFRRKQLSYHSEQCASFKAHSHFRAQLRKMLLMLFHQYSNVVHVAQHTDVIKMDKGEGYNQKPKDVSSFWLNFLKVL